MNCWSLGIYNYCGKITITGERKGFVSTNFFLNTSGGLGLYEYDEVYVSLGEIGRLLVCKISGTVGMYDWDAGLLGI